MAKRVRPGIRPAGRYLNLKSELVRVGVSQAQVAAHLGISPTSLNAKINGHVPFFVPEVTEMRDVFMPEATLDFLLTCEK